MSDQVVRASSLLNTKDHVFATGGSISKNELSSIGLNSEESSVLMTTTLEEWKLHCTHLQEMRIIIKLVISGKKIVPWVDNTALQVYSKIMQEAVFTPLPRSPIPKTYPIDVSLLEQGDTTVATSFEPGWKYNDTAIHVWRWL